MTHICMDCTMIIGTSEGEGVSHGLCPSCLALRLSQTLEGHQWQSAEQRTEYIAHIKELLLEAEKGVRS